MIDRDVLLRKSEAIEHHASRVRRKLPLDTQALEADESLMNDLCFDLLQAIQACIDLAVHACSHDSLGVPESPAYAFALLAKHRIISAPLSDRLGRAAGLRNLLVHRYADLSASKLIQSIATGLDDLDEFAVALRSHASASHPPTA